MLPSRERVSLSGFYEQLSLSASIPESVFPRKIINPHAGRYGSYGGFSLKKQLSIVLLVSLAVFVAMAQVAPAIAEHQGHETSDEHNEVHQVTFRIDLTGSQQVGPVATEAFGMATVRLADNGAAIDFRVIVCDIVNVTASHIHVGAAGTNGPVIIPFVHGVLFSSPHGCKTLAEGTRTASDLNTQASPSIRAGTTSSKPSSRAIPTSTSTQLPTRVARSGAS